MNFYIGDSIEEINLNDVNVEFSDDLIDYIYNLRIKVPLDMSKLYQIDPYSDVEISKDDLLEIIDICNYIINGVLLTDYEEQDEGNRMLHNLIELAQEAKIKDLGLISIGD